MMILFVLVGCGGVEEQKKIVNLEHFAVNF